MLYEIMKHIRNFFLSGQYEDGDFVIEDGKVSLPFLKDGQYFLIEGSALNDGVYQYPNSALVDETFSGRISALNVPKAFLNLAEEITAYSGKYEATPYTSESFGGYSYTKAHQSWQSAFSTRLNAWRKI